MATEYVFFKGKGSWVNPHKINQWGKYAMVLHPDQESLATFKAMQEEKGIKNSLSKDDDGWYFRLTRNSEITVRGKKVGLSPPEVFDGSRPLPDGGFAPLTVAVGNGSDVVVKAEVYNYTIPGSAGKKGWAMRWLSVRVDNLNPYQKSHFEDGAQVALEGMDKQTKLMF